MSCPFLDPSMLARIPPQKREEFKETYHRMKKEEVEHLKIDVKEDDIQDISPEQMMMGITGESLPSEVNCPVMKNGGSGGQESVPDFQEQFQNDPQAFMERMSQMQSEGGSCPFMTSSNLLLIYSN